MMSTLSVDHLLGIKYLKLSAVLNIKSISDDFKYLIPNK